MILLYIFILKVNCNYIQKPPSSCENHHVLSQLMLIVMPNAWLFYCCCPSYQIGGREREGGEPVVNIYCFTVTGWVRSEEWCVNAATPCIHSFLTWWCGDAELCGPPPCPQHWDREWWCFYQDRKKGPVSLSKGWSPEWPVLIILQPWFMESNINHVQSCQRCSPSWSYFQSCRCINLI